ncbi:MAG: FAD-binding oxidoreductase [Deltaproteobacteria bacterium]|nr:FAD-binding oxidoreductase [Deltaproteobacteria bacterium]
MRRERSEVVSGFGGFHRRRARLIELESAADLDEYAIEPVLPRGAGRSYGDAALAPSLVRLVGSAQSSVDESRRLLDAPAQLTIREAVELTARKGLGLPVVPGTGLATLGGCVAADIHGKNHHKCGSFEACVESFELVSPDGIRRRCSRETESELFFATLGGMGLTGLITRVSLRLERAVPTVRREVRVRDSLEEVVRELTESKATYSVAFVDPMARRGKLGRGMVELAEPSESPDRSWRLPTLSTPPTPFNLVRRSALQVFDALVLESARRLAARGPRLVAARRFFFPLDGLSDWNRLYGPKGFVQLQVLVPKLEDLVHIVEAVGRLCPSIGLGVLKVLGDKGSGLLSFPDRGLCLALDLPASSDLHKALDLGHDLTLEAGGRLYLAKDAAMRPRHFRGVYGSAIDRFLSVKDRVDPKRSLRSDQAMRIGLL